MTGGTVPWQIVGVFHNVRTDSLRNEGRPEIDVPFSQSPWPQAGIVVRTTGDPAAMTQEHRCRNSLLRPTTSARQHPHHGSVLDQALLGDQFIATLFASFAGVALLLAAVGIYGVMAFGVAQRTHEIGLRMALGAGKDQVLRLILTEGLVLALIGLGFGLLGAYSLGRAMHSTLYGVGTLDLGAFGAVALILLAVGTGRVLRACAACRAASIPWSRCATNSEFIEDWK